MDFFRALEERPTTHTSQQSYVLSPKPTGTKVESITREHAAAAVKAKLNKNKVSIEMAQPITVKRRKLVMQPREQPPPAQGPASQPSIPSPRDLTLHPHSPVWQLWGFTCPGKHQQKPPACCNQLCTVPVLSRARIDQGQTKYPSA